MKQALKEVLLDLLFFAKDFFRGLFSFSEKQDSEVSTQEALASATNILDSPESVIYDDFIEGQKMYISEDSVSCYLAPKRFFDSKVTTLNYGEEVLFIRSEGDFSQVQTGDVAGWVFSSLLTDNPQHVFPNFVSERTYTADDPEVLRLRKCIKDEMMGGEISMVLQSPEFILYKLWRERIVAPWEVHAPRIAGAWQPLLRGKRGIQIGIEPRTKSVLECSGSGQRPFLGYVESVHPDHSIVLESVGREVDGEYRTERISQSDWKEWRPVFISMT